MHIVKYLLVKTLKSKIILCGKILINSRMRNIKRSHFYKRRITCDTANLPNVSFFTDTTPAAPVAPSRNVTSNVPIPGTAR